MASNGLESLTFCLPVIAIATVRAVQRSHDVLQALIALCVEGGNAIWKKKKYKLNKNQVENKYNSQAATLALCPHRGMWRVIPPISLVLI